MASRERLQIVVASTAVLRWAILLAIISRIAVAGWAVVDPIRDQRGEFVSPKLVFTGTDAAFYAQSREVYFQRPLIKVLLEFSSYYIPTLGDGDGPKALNEAGVDYYLAPPLFPTLMELFDYGAGNALPLSIFFVFLSAATAILWLIWLYARGAGAFWLLLFAIMPSPLWFMLAVSTDTLFAFLMAVLVCIGFWPGRQLGVRTFYFSAAMALVMSLTRPNGLSLVVFSAFLALVILLQTGNRAQRLSIIAALALVAAPLSYFLLPHYVVYVADGMDITYFDVPQRDYLGGLLGFEGLLAAGDEAASIVALAGAKLLYLVGLRPSYGELNPWLLVIRMAPGVILLPGLIKLLISGRVWERGLIAIYLLPVLSGATQDRYLLPIAPLLFFYGTQLYSSWFNALFRSTRHT